MITKSIYLDTWRTTETTVTVAQGEVNARFLHVYLVSSGVPVDLTGCSAAVYCTKPDGTTIFNDCEVTDAEKGLICVPMTQQMSLVPGQLKDVEIRVTDSDSVLKVRGLRVIVRPTGNYDEAIESTDEFTALEQALRDVDRVTQSGLTEAGKQEIVEAMLAELPTWEGGEF